MSAADRTPLDAQRLAKVKADAALAGIAVHAMGREDGSAELFARRWGLEKRFANLDALEVWLARVTGSDAGEKA